MSVSPTLPTHKCTRRLGETVYCKATLQNDTISSASWDAAFSGGTRTTPVTGSTSTEAVYLLPSTLGTYKIDCIINTVGSQRVIPCWEVTVVAC